MVTLQSPEAGATTLSQPAPETDSRSSGGIWRANMEAALEAVGTPVAELAVPGEGSGAPQSNRGALTRRDTLGQRPDRH